MNLEIKKSRNQKIGSDVSVKTPLIIPLILVLFLRLKFLIS